MSPARGRPLTFDGRRVLLNPGSVGQPRDGIPTASWLLLDTGAGTATWQRTAYDVAAVQEAMVARGLPRTPRRPAVVWALGAAPMIGGRRPIKGRKPGDKRVRVERPHAPYFRYTGPGS